MIRRVSGEVARGTTRRAALIAGTAGVLGLALGGCSVRLEDDAPALPGLETRGPAPDQDLLLASWRSLQSLSALAASVPAGDSVWIAPIASAHRAQQDRLAGLIAGLGVTPSPGAPTVSAATGGTAEALRTAEMRLIPGSDLAAVAAGQSDNVPMLTSILAFRAAASTVLGTTPAIAGARTPSGQVAVHLLAAVRPAVYGLEIVAARTPAKQRDQVRDTLKAMYGARSRLEGAAGSAAPPDQLSYQLPVAVTDEASGKQLAQQLLAAVVTASASQASALRGQSAQLGGLIQLWSTAASWGWRWGSPVEPFPGLTA